jgi:hypothetical protein
MIRREFNQMKTNFSRNKLYSAAFLLAGLLGFVHLPVLLALPVFAAFQNKISSCLLLILITNITG